MRILVAAKDKLVRSALIFLINYGYIGIKEDVEEAIDSIHLLEKLRSKNVDMVIIEWGFFYDEALEMIALLKKAYPGIIFIATGIKKEDKKVALDAKIDGFYLRSDSPGKLINMIEGYSKKFINLLN